MAESNPHITHIINTREILRHRLRAEKMVSVDADMLLFFQKGFPKRRVAPDVFVVWGVPQKRRRSFKLWIEGQAPQVIFEFTSRETQDEDLGTKRAIYARLGVEEYYLFDPYGEYLLPPLRGYQLAGEEYVMRTMEPLLPPTFNGKNGNGSLTGWRLMSERLKLELWALPTGEIDMPYLLRFYDPATEQWLPDPGQAMVERELFAKQATEAKTQAERESIARRAEAEARRIAEARVEREAEARQNAEAEVTRLKAELEKLRAKISQHENKSN